MIKISLIKDRLIDKLWFPTVKKGGAIFYSRLSKNKKMKVFTLTGDENFREIVKFVEGSLTKNEHVVAWNYSHFKKLRLETDPSPSLVLGTTKYEDSISSSSFSLSNHFPFDVINLDFSSQDPLPESGRIEKEIQSLEETIKLQHESDKKNREFVLIFTTLLNSHSLDYGNVVRTSNAMEVSGWQGLHYNDFRQNITDQVEKIKCIESVLDKICLKYHYYGKFRSLHYRLGREQRRIYSVAGILLRGE